MSTKRNSERCCSEVWRQEFWSGLALPAVGCAWRVNETDITQAPRDARTQVDPKATVGLTYLSALQLVCTALSQSCDLQCPIFLTKWCLLETNSRQDVPSELVGRDGILLHDVLPDLWKNSFPFSGSERRYIYYPDFSLVVFIVFWVCFFLM